MVAQGMEGHVFWTGVRAYSRNALARAAERAEPVFGAGKFYLDTLAIRSRRELRPRKGRKQGRDVFIVAVGQRLPPPIAHKRSVRKSAHLAL